MAKSEPVSDTRDRDLSVFDDGEDEFDEDEDGSRLPLLVVIGVLVLASFIGVVWLAYEHGVQRGLRDAPRVVSTETAPADPQAYDKIYQKPAPPDEDEAADDNTAPVTPAPNMNTVPPAAAPAPSAEKPALTHPKAAPAPATKTASLAPKPTTPPAAKPPALQPQRVATKPPAKLVPAPAAATPAKTASAKPAAAPAASAAPAGDYVLQIGSYKSQAEADAAWSAFKARHKMVAAYGENVQQADLGAKGVWYRLRIGSFPSKDAADAFCAKLKADGGACLLAKK